MTGSRIGIHAGVWGFDWSPAAADRAIRGAADAGYDLIEIPAIDRNRYDASDTSRALERSGIQPAVSLALTVTGDISDTDPARVVRGRSRLLEAVEFAQDIGATFVGGVVFSAMTRYHTVPTRQRTENALSVLRVVADRAREVGITLGIEYVNRYESNLLNTAAQTAVFVEELGADNVVVHMDTFHAALEETSLPAAVAAAGAHLGYIHASENHRGRLGTGTTDWPGFIRALDEYRYSGPITVETFSSAVVDEDAAIDIALWRPLWTDPDQLAAEAHAFLRDQLAAVPALQP